MSRTLTNYSDATMSYVETLRHQLEEAEAEYEQVRSYPRRTLPMYGYSTKEEVLELIQEEIDRIEGELELCEYDYEPWELEEERDSLCRSLGLARYC